MHVWTLVEWVLWNPLEKAFLDIRVFHAQAISNRQRTIPNMYKHHEQLKKREYNARVIEVEKASFSPLVFSTAGGMAKEANSFFKVIAQKWSRKTNQTYADSISFIRRRLRFDLLKTTVIALRGYRGKRTEERGNDDINELDLNLYDQPID